jgi:hypothetical protein
MVTLDQRVLILAPDDNVGVAVRELPAGTEIAIGDHVLCLAQRVEVGHKFALKPIPAGERVIKYSAPIGRATRPIAAGDYVHSHNLASEHLPSTTIESEDSIA